MKLASVRRQIRVMGIISCKTGRRISTVNRIAGTKELGMLTQSSKTCQKTDMVCFLWGRLSPPQCAVDCFLHWTSLPENNLTKSGITPNIKRNEMVTKRDMWPHSPAMAVEVWLTTIFRLDTGMLVPMGGDFDFMDERSHHYCWRSDREVELNRECLRYISGKQSDLKLIVTSGGIMFWQMNLYPDTYFTFCIA